MDQILYDRMLENDDRHWWYRARRSVLAAIIRDRIKPPSRARILEIGCGTGHNLAMLGGFGHIDAIEIEESARAEAARRLGRPVFEAPLPSLDGFGEGGYDLVALLDVLEHIEDEQAALKSIARLLGSGGRILIAVPAHPWLWSPHDVANHHWRRYTRKTLHHAITDAGLTIDHMTAINTLLFPLAVISRLTDKLRGTEGAADAVPPAPLNWAFEKIFAAEAHLVGRISLPIGVSLVAIISV